ncbi:MAG: oligoribonuclease [Oligoflexia bacterium]|nr:oligoribonuclease [Oligoflexia bacterium]
MPSTPSKKPLFWIDLEMTGLDDTVDTILEVAVVVTDQELKPLETFHRVVYQTPDVLSRMNDWCKKTHGESGLTAAVATGTPLEKVEKELIELIDRHFSSRDRIVLVGNSVGNDKRFVDRYMPELAKRLHYRLIDVSSFKEVFRERYGIQFEKKNAHRAIDDIHESIKELAHYLSFVHMEGAKS